MPCSLLYSGLSFRRQKYPSHGLLLTFFCNWPHLHKFPLGISPFSGSPVVLAFPEARQIQSGDLQVEMPPSHPHPRSGLSWLALPSQPCKAACGFKERTLAGCGGVPDGWSPRTHAPFSGVGQPRGPHHPTTEQHNLGPMFRVHHFLLFFLRNLDPNSAGMGFSLER